MIEDRPSIGALTDVVAADEPMRREGPVELSGQSCGPPDSNWYSGLAMTYPVAQRKERPCTRSNRPGAIPATFFRP